MGLIVKNIRKRWPGNCLVYNWGQALNSTEKNLILQAMDDWQRTGFVRFIERTTQDRYVTFIPDTEPLDGIHSSDSLGMAGGEQFIRLDHSPGARTLRHEIGHALGLYHEQKRRDRDNFIIWNKAKTKDEHKSQFEKANADEAQAVGVYDLSSVMHYGSAKSMSIDRETALITTRNPNNQNKIGSSNISPGDTESVKIMQKGNEHVYQLGVNGQMETVAQQKTWSSGWTIATPYTIGLNNYIFLLKTSNGRMHVNKINFDGSIGDIVQNQDWSSGWTQAVKYNIGLFNFMMLYKKDSGKINIHRLDADGKIGEKIDEGTLEANWSFAAHFSILTSNYMLFSNTQGKVYVHEITWEGKIGQRKHNHNFSNGYTITQPYSVLGASFLFMLKSSTGTVKIRKIGFDGSIGEVIQGHDWTSGWTSAIPYHVGAFNFLLLHKKDGTFHVNRIEGNGKIGPVLDSRLLSPGGETIAVYGVGVGTYTIIINPD